jgi:hypothetical protein
VAFNTTVFSGFSGPNSVQVSEHKQQTTTTAEVWAEHE